MALKNRLCYCFSVLKTLKKNFRQYRFFFLTLFFLVICYDSYRGALAWHSTSLYLPANSDSPDYVISSFRNFINLKDHFSIHQLFTELTAVPGRNFRTTIVSYLLVPFLFATGGKVLLSIAILNSILLILLAFPIFILSLKYFGEIGALFLTSGLMLSAWVQSDLILFISELPMLVTFTWTVFCWFHFEKNKLPFFICLLLATLVRPIEALVFFFPIVAYELISGLKNRSLTLRTLSILSGSLALELLAFFAIHRVYDGFGYPAQLTLWLLVLSTAALAFIGYKVRKSSFMLGSVLFLGGNWLWYFPVTEAFRLWFSLGTNDPDNFEKVNMSKFHELTHLLSSFGALPLITVMIAAAYFSRRKFRHKYKIITLVISCFALPPLSMLTTNPVLRYYHPNNMMFYYLFLSVCLIVTSTLAKKRRALGIAALFSLSILFNTINKNIWPVNEKYFHSPANILGMTDQENIIVDSNIVDSVLDGLKANHPDVYFGISTDKDVIWTQLNEHILNLRSAERGLKFMFNDVKALRKIDHDLLLPNNPNLGGLLLGPQNVVANFSFRRLDVGGLSNDRCQFIPDYNFQVFFKGATKTFSVLMLDPACKRE